MSSSVLLELSAVSYEIHGKRILNTIDWRIESQQHWVLLGRNGAGKTTLLQIACGYLWPNAGGEVLRGGVPLTDLRQLRRRIGWVTSTLDALIPRCERAVDTVVSGRYAGIGLKRLGGCRPTSADYRDALGYLQRLGMAAFTQQAFGVLSQGERQKVLLARACMAQPMLMVLDEPCAGLDPASRESFLAALQNLADSGAGPAMILVTHHVEEIMPAFSHLLVLDGGRVVGAGPTCQLLDRPLVDRLYDGAVSELIWHNGRCWPIGR
ncbi:MAG: ABC transporter ATP-binding protein [Pirellulaceae bacterium]